MAKAGRGSDQFPLRLPEGLRERIRQIAEQNGRSMNAEIISRLEESFETDDRMADPAKTVDDLLPFFEMMKSEFDNRYQKRITGIENVLESLGGVLKKGLLSEEQQKELGQALEGTKHGRPAEPDRAKKQGKSEK